MRPIISDEESLHENAKAMLFASFDNGITHFDLANNYGPAPGAAESRVGRILKENFKDIATNSLSRQRQVTDVAGSIW